MPDTDPTSPSRDASGVPGQGSSSAAAVPEEDPRGVPQYIISTSPYYNFASLQLLKMQLKSFTPFLSFTLWSAMPSSAVLVQGTDATTAEVRLGHDSGSEMQSPLGAAPSWRLKYCSMFDCHQLDGGTCEVRTGQQVPPGGQPIDLSAGAVSILFSSDIPNLGVRLFTGAGCTGKSRDFWPVYPIDCQEFHDGLPWGAESFLFF